MYVYIYIYIYTELPACTYIISCYVVLYCMMRAYTACANARNHEVCLSLTRITYTVNISHMQLPTCTHATCILCFLSA